MLNLPLLLLLAPCSVVSRPSQVHLQKPLDTAEAFSPQWCPGTSANGPRSLSPILAPTVQLIYEFGNFRLENLAPRSNGHLLLTASNQPYLLDIDPTASSPSPSMLPSIPGVTSLVGITEISSDVFAVAAGNYSGQKPGPGSAGIWKVDMTQAKPTVKLITQIPTAEGLNGVAALNGFSGTILVADSVLGVVYKVDVSTGAYSIAIQHDDFAPTQSTTVGINGLRMSRGDLYFTNTAQGLFGRMPLDYEGAAEGDVQILARSNASVAKYDDFDVDCGGNAWIGTHPDHVDTVTSRGAQSNMTGGATPFLHPTSARFGRGRDAGRLYVVDYGNQEISGQLVAVDGLSLAVQGGGFRCLFD